MGNAVGLSRQIGKAGKAGLSRLKEKKSNAGLWYMHPRSERGCVSRQ